MKMDSYERFVRALDFEEPDRVPIFDSIHNDRIVREVGGEGSPEEVIPRTYHRLGMDISFQELWDPLGDECLLERTWKTTRWGNLIFNKPLTWKWASLGDGRHTDWLIERPFKSLEDLRAMKVETLMSEDELIGRHLIEYQDSKRAYEKYGIVKVGCGGGILQGIPRLLGWPLFARAVYQARDLIPRLMDVHMIEARANMKAYVEAKAGPAYMLADDIAEKNGLMHTPSFLKGEWLPRIRDVIQPARKAGIKLLYHSEGNTEGILNDLIDIGFQGLNPLEPYAMDLRRIKEKFGDRMVLTGSIDNGYLLQHGSPEEVEHAIRECIRIAAPGSGFCPGSSGELNPTTPLTNAVTMYKTIRKYGVYPKLDK